MHYVTSEIGVSFEELAGAMELVHDPEKWLENDREDAQSQLESIAWESPTNGQEELDLQQIPLALPVKDGGDKGEGSLKLPFGRMPFDQLPHLVLDTPTKTSQSDKLKDKQVALESPPAIVYDVHPLLEFARSHFNLVAPRAFPFHKPVDFDLSKRLEWEKKVIATPLTRLPKDQTAIAVQAFRNVSGFMGNRASGKGKIDHCFKLLRNVVPRSPALKDEVYCQLCKQLTRNPSAYVLDHGLSLLLVQSYEKL